MCSYNILNRLKYIFIHLSCFTALSKVTKALCFQLLLSLLFNRTGFWCSLVRRQQQVYNKFNFNAGATSTMEYTPAGTTRGWGVIRRHHFEVGVKRTALRFGYEQRRIELKLCTEMQSILNVSGGVLAFVETTRRLCQLPPNMKPNIQLAVWLNKYLAYWDVRFSWCWMFIF
jgi:hypothetical protein